MKEVTVNQDLPEVATQNMKGYWTIAVFGVDARDNAIKKDTNADVNIICSINLENGEIKLVSVYRDSYLNISQEKGSYNKWTSSGDDRVKPQPRSEYYGLYHL